MKKQTMVLFGALAAVALLLGQTSVSPLDVALAQDDPVWTVSVIIHELQDLDDEDQSGAYDFYHHVIIDESLPPCNNEEQQQEGELITPEWLCPRDVTGDSPEVLIFIWIKDDDWPFVDDVIDVNPDGERYIFARFWPATHQIQIWDHDREDWDGEPWCAHSRIEMQGTQIERARIVFTVTATAEGARGGDSDLDGLTDADEVCGMDGNDDGTIDVDLPAMGADPFRKDLFVELDWMVDDDTVAPNDHSHEPWLPALMNAWHEFDMAPVTDPPAPDGVARRGGIALHVDVGDLYTNYDLDFDGDGDDEINVGADGQVDVDPDGPYGPLLPDGIPDIGDLGTLGNGTLGGGNRICANLLPGPCLQPWQVGEEVVLSPAEASLARDFNFVEARARAFRYAIFAHNNQDDALGLSPYGLVDSPVDFVVTLGARPNQPGGLVGPAGLPVRGAIGDHTGVFLHELGHRLGLCHGGARPAELATCMTEPDAWFNDNRKPNYISVMNYDFTLRGVTYQLDDIGLADPLVGFDYDHDGQPDNQRYTYSLDLPAAEYHDPAAPDHPRRGGLPPLNELLLDEPEGVGDGTAIVFYGPSVDLNADGACDSERLCPRTAVGNLPIDWDRNDEEEDEGVSTLAFVPPDPPGIHLDINRDGLGIAGDLFLWGFNDYNHLQNQRLKRADQEEDGAQEGLSDEEDDAFVHSLVRVIELTEAQAAAACHADSVRDAKFEGLVPGETVTNQYAAQGIYFLADGIRQPTVAGPPERFDLPTSSLPHSLVNSPAPPATSFDVPLVVTFDPPVRVVSLRLGRVTEGEPATDLAVLTAYDADGFPMGSVQRNIPDFNQGVTAHLALGAIFPQLLISRVELNYELLSANPLEPEQIDDLIICRDLVARDPGFPDGPAFGEQEVRVEVRSEVHYPVETGIALQPWRWEGEALAGVMVEWQRLDAGGDDTDATPFALNLNEGEHLRLTAPADGFHPQYGPLTFIYWREGENIYFSREEVEIAARVLRNSTITAVYRAAPYRTYLPMVTRGHTAPVPTTVVLTPSADAYVSAAAPTTNYGTALTLYAGQDETSLSRSLFRFDMGDIPSGCTVDSALFQAYLVDSSTSPPSLDVELRRVDGSWTESGVTWKAQPGTASIGKINAVGVAPGYYGWDVTGLVLDWLGTTPNNGLALWSHAETTFGWRGFASREAGTPTQPPQLIITCQP